MLHFVVQCNVVLCCVVQERWIAPIDPGAVLELEKCAKLVSADLVHIMDTLRNSLHAVSPMEARKG